MNGSRWMHAAAVALVLTTFGCSVDRAGGNAAREVTTLTFAQPITGAPPPQLLAWADQVGRLTDGSVEITFENGWRAGDADFEAGTLKDVQDGEIDLAWVGARVFDTVGVDSLQPLLAPMLVDSQDLQRAVFDDGIPEEMLAAVEELDLVGIGVLPGPMRKILGIETAFVKPQDFAGKVVGMQDSALVEETFRTLGATTKAVPASASLDGLDAYEQQLDSIAGNGYQADAKYVTSDLNLWPRSLVILAGESIYQDLPEEHQQALRDASRKAMIDAAVGAKDLDEENGALLCDSTLTFETIGEDGLAAIRRRLEPVYTSLREDPTTAGFLDRIETLKTSVGVGPDTVDCGGSEEASGAIPNGTYRQTATMGDLERFCGPGYPDPDLPFPGITDKGFTLEIKVTGDRIVQSGYAAGHPELTEVGSTETYRTYRDTIEITETGATNPFSGTWSLDGNTLTISDLDTDGCEARVVFEAHPWLKVE